MALKKIWIKILKTTAKNLFSSSPYLQIYTQAYSYAGFQEKLLLVNVDFLNNGWSKHNENTHDRYWNNNEQPIKICSP